jgi:hypothetical protein
MLFVISCTGLIIVSFLTCKCYYNRNPFQDVSDYICLNKNTFKSSPSNDRHSYAKNNHATKSSQPSQVESVASQHIGRGSIPTF